MTLSNELLGHHLRYEVWMLRETHKRFSLDDVVLNNALIESFCLHARNLIEFLDKKSQNYTTKNYRPFNHVKNRKEITTINRRINVQISHVIYEGRTVKESEKINVDERAKILAILNEEISQFVVHLVEPYASFLTQAVTSRWGPLKYYHHLLQHLCRSFF